MSCISERTESSHKIYCKRMFVKFCWCIKATRSWLDLWPPLVFSACQGDAGNVFPPIMCVFNTSGAKSRWCLWRCALRENNLLFSLLYRRMKTDRRMINRMSVCLCKVNPDQYNLTELVSCTRVSFVLWVLHYKNTETWIYLTVFDDVFMMWSESFITETRAIKTSEWITDITRALYHNCPYKSHKQMVC